MDARAPRVAILADDLIWASRLVAAVERSGAVPAAARTDDELRRILGDEAADVRAVVVDLNGRRYDGVAAVAVAAGTGRAVVAVGQHEDLPLRKRALDAGARRVYSYNKLFQDGPAVMRALLEPVA